MRVDTDLRLEYLGFWDPKMQCTIDRSCSEVMWSNQRASAVVKDI